MIQHVSQSQSPAGQNEVVPREEAIGTALLSRLRAVSNDNAGAVAELQFRLPTVIANNTIVGSVASEVLAGEIYVNVAVAIAIADDIADVVAHGQPNKLFLPNIFRAFSPVNATDAVSVPVPVALLKEAIMGVDNNNNNNDSRDHQHQ